MTYNRRRPRHTKKDANHSLVGDLVREFPYWKGYRLRCIDTADMGGNMLDWFVSLGPLCFLVEVKQPGKAGNLTAGESETVLHWESLAFVVTDETELMNVLDAMLPFARHITEELRNETNR